MKCYRCKEELVLIEELMTSYIIKRKYFTETIMAFSCENKDCKVRTIKEVK